MEYIIEKLIGGEFWQFVGMFMLICIAASIFAYVMQLILTLVSRLLRTIKVLIRGWPPAHLDADGDWPPTDKSEDEEEEK